VTDTDT